MKIRIPSHSRLREIILFVVVGISNTAVDFAVLNLLILLTGHYEEFWLLPFNGLAFLAAVINSYILNGRITFRHSGPGDRWRFLRFVAVNAIGLVVNSLIVWALSPVLDAMFDALIAINASKTLATGVSLCWNYFAIKRWIFRRGKTVEAHPHTIPDNSENGIAALGTTPSVDSVMESEIKSAV